MTYREICAQLTAAGIEDAASEAGLLLSRFCGVRPYELPFRRDEQFSSEALKEAVARRGSREPLQYLIGQWDFFGMTFSVNHDCLIPRPDTELLVEQAISLMPGGAHFADFCTGSGCIAAAVLANRPDTTCVAVDAFEKTLDVARQNCKDHGVAHRTQFMLRDLLLPMTDAFAPKFDCILSNPPYIPSSVVTTLAPELSFEPQVALDGGEDGLIFYRHFLSQSEQVLKEDGFWLFEIGYDQQEAICNLAGEYGFVCTVMRDLGGNPRVAYLRRKN